MSKVSSLPEAVFHFEHGIKEGLIKYFLRDMRNFFLPKYMSSPLHFHQYYVSLIFSQGLQIICLIALSQLEITDSFVYFLIWLSWNSKLHEEINYV